MSDTEKKPRGYWNYDTCYAAAKECSKIIEFQRKYGHAYKLARVNNWLKDYTWFESPQKQHGYWNNYNHCYEAAKQCKTISEFKKKFGGANCAARKNDWLKDYTWFEKKERKPKGYYTYDVCFAIAKDCKNGKEMQRKCATAYSVALKNKWVKDYTWFDKNPNVERNNYVVYSYNDINSNAVYVGLTNDIERRHREHCNGQKKHGKTKYDTVYNYFNSIGMSIPKPVILKSNINGDEAKYYEQYYVDLYKSNGKNVLNIAKTGSVGCFSKYDYNVCYEIAKECTSSGEMAEKNHSAYQLAAKNGWIKDYVWFTNYKERISKSLTKWTKESVYEIALTCKSRKELQKLNSTAYQKALTNGWINDYTWMKKNTQKPKGYWNYDSCYNIALNCKTRVELQKKYTSAYLAALKNGWIKDYVWLTPSRSEKKWNYETCREKALMCDTRTDYNIKYGGAYHLALKNGWLDEFFPKVAA